jgi:hypothetical protein
MPRIRISVLSEAVGAGARWKRTRVRPGERRPSDARRKTANDVRI